MARVSESVLDEIATSVETDICANRTSNPELVIPVYDDISLDQFYRDHLSKNHPCIIKNATKDWYAASEWVTSSRRPDVDAIKRDIASAVEVVGEGGEVSVVNCKERDFNDQRRSEWTFENYVTYWKNKHNESSEDTTSDDETLYCKDWHLAALWEAKSGSADNSMFYQVHPCFQDDWINDYCLARHKARGTEKIAQDFRFVYLGPKGSWTPLHCDVWHSYSWSANVCGRKKWIFFPPSEETKLQSVLNPGTVPYDISDISLVNEKEFPHVKDAKYAVVEQGPGEAIFVPTGWWHQVCNLEPTLSINHNWGNAWCIGDITTLILTHLDQVIKELADLEDGNPDWYTQIMDIHRAYTGFDVQGLLDLFIDRINRIDAAVDAKTASRLKLRIDILALREAAQQIVNHAFILPRLARAGKIDKEEVEMVVSRIDSLYQRLGE